MKGRIRRIAQAARGRFKGSAAQDFLGRLRVIDFVNAIVLFGASLLLSVLPFIILLSSLANHRIDADLSRHIGLNREGARIVSQLFRSSPAHSAVPIVTALVLATAGTMAVADSLQVIYERVFGQQHRGWRDVLRFVAWAGVLFGILVTESVISKPVQAAGGLVTRGLVGYAGTAAFFWWTMHFLLAGRMQWRRLIPAALLTALLWMGLELFSSVYFSGSIVSDSRLYGTIGVVFTLLTWFIAIGAVIVLGAVGGATWDQRKGKAPHPRRVVPGQKPAPVSANHPRKGDVRGCAEREDWMVPQSQEAIGAGPRSAPWLARLSFALILSAIAVVAVAAGLRSLVMLAVGLAAAVVSLMAAFWFLSRRGALRWLAMTVFVAAPVAVLAVYALHSLLWVALVAAAGWLLAGVTARAALARERGEWRMPEYAVSRPAGHPFLIMNPKSGGGKVGRFDLQRKATDLGAEVFMLDGPEPVDIAEVARAAIAGGADLLGVAGGDGTQALVAGIAAEHGIPFMVITAGTRNHFALDLGLDRDNPSACLGALGDPVELRVDLGVVGGRTFVNNASFGAYAEVVEAPAYRDDKVRTTLELLPDLLGDQRGPRLTAHTDGAEITAPQALLVANNPYGTGDVAGLGRRARLDRGVLGVVAVTVNNARQAADLIRNRHAGGLRVLTAQEVTVTAGTRQLPVGIDGEAVSLPVPVRCVVRPGALRVWVPRDRPGIPAPKPELNWARLRHLAGWRHGPRPAGAPEAGNAPRREC